MIRNGLVTGAARGIGRAIALRLAKDGFNVALNDVEDNSAQLQKVQKEIEQIGQKSIAITGNVSVSRLVEKMMQDAAQKLGSLDVVVANAGIFIIRSLLDISVDEWDRVFAVNMRGVFLCYKEAAKVMIKQGTGGKIIGASSTAGYKAYSLLSDYCASKWGVRGLTQAAAMELAEHKITVNACCPGFIDTKMIDYYEEEFAKHQGTTRKEIYVNILKSLPLGRKRRVDDVANLVSFLASRDADYITGQSIMVNGGMHFS